MREKEKRRLTKWVRKKVTGKSSNKKRGERELEMKINEYEGTVTHK